MWKIFLAVIIQLAASDLVFAQDASGFVLTLMTSNRAEVSVNGGTPITNESSSSASATAEGKEKSACEDYGRTSAASASAQTEVSNQKADFVEVKLSTKVRANGGHFRTCLLGCSPPIFGIPSKCLGLHGNDTSAKAVASAGAILKVSFDPEFPPTDYAFDFSLNSDSLAMVAELKDNTGNVIPLRRTSGDAQILRGRPGAVYFLTLRLPLEASDAGGCCSDAKIGTSTVTAGVRIQRAPILDAQSQFFPYIAGGSQTTAYSYVGALKIDNKSLCTGTLIGPTTVLTAGHCVFGFEDRLKNSGIFIVGSNINQPDEPPLKVVGFAIPTDYNPKTYDNDIALIYLGSQPTSKKLVSLHAGQPTWVDLISKKVSLTFVGFGYDIDDGQQVGLGVKREASWFMSAFTNKTVSFGAADKGTCKGDSGGPAFLIDGGVTTQVAVTSGSATNSCKDGGVETRVDYYLPWITARLK